MVCLEVSVKKLVILSAACGVGKSAVTDALRDSDLLQDFVCMGSRTGIEPNCPSVMHFRIFRRAFTRKIGILLRKITPKSIKNAFADGCEQF